MIVTSNKKTIKRFQSGMEGLTSISDKSKAETGQIDLQHNSHVN